MISCNRIHAKTDGICTVNFLRNILGEWKGERSKKERKGNVWKTACQGTHVIMNLNDFEQKKTLNP